VKELDVVTEAAEVHGFTKLFALFSGGHDSLCATHVAAQHPLFKGVVHINTGIGIEQTRQFVRDTCKRNHWPLYEYHPPVSFEEIVKEFGFPGPAMHNLVYNRLKERCLRQLTKEHKEHRLETIGLASGVRSEESSRRMRHVERIQKDGSRIYCAVIHDWDKKRCNDYITENNLERNAVVDLVHMSGECLCGAFAHPGEREELRLWFPDAVAEIERIEVEVAKTEKPCVWGQRPTKVKGQEEMAFMPLCVGCAKREDDHANGDQPPEIQ
jgi:3'-phosphoadenosine 5'-phosphosulfate sulfotransferase (PAPS reductase)/FAD synthetase